MSSQSPYTKPSKLFEFLQKRFPVFNSFKQQDSLECLCAIFQCFEDQNREEKSFRFLSILFEELSKWDCKTIRKWIETIDLNDQNELFDLLNAEKLIEMVKIAKNPLDFIDWAENLTINRRTAEILLCECSSLRSGSSYFLREMIHQKQLQNDFQKTLWESFPPENIFGGIQESRISCLNCQNEQIVYEDFTVLSVPISFDKTEAKVNPWKKDINFREIMKLNKLKIRGGLPLTSCLDFYTRREILDDENSIPCGKCNSDNKIRNKTSKTYRLLTVPNILVIHLKRFWQKGKKLTKCDKIVTFEQQLDVESYLSDSCGQSGSTRYSLIGVVEHSGQLKSGHYVAYVKNRREKWYNCSDTAVKKVKEKDVFKAEAYILFYHRIK